MSEEVSRGAQIVMEHEHRTSATMFTSDALDGVATTDDKDDSTALDTSSSYLQQLPPTESDASTLYRSR